MCLPSIVMLCLVCTIFSSGSFDFSLPASFAGGVAACGLALVDSSAASNGVAIKTKEKPSDKMMLLNMFRNMRCGPQKRNRKADSAIPISLLEMHRSEQAQKAKIFVGVSGEISRYI